jgi:hypothetical protein
MRLFKHNDILYLVLREMYPHTFHNKAGEFLNDKLLSWKQFLGAEHVLKVEDRFLFVEEIKPTDFEDLNIEENEDSN